MSALKIQVMYRKPQLLRGVLNKIIPLMSPINILDIGLYKTGIILIYIIFILVIWLYGFRQVSCIIIVNTKYRGR